MYLRRQGEGTKTWFCERVYVCVYACVNAHACVGGAYTGRVGQNHRYTVYVR